MSMYKDVWKIIYKLLKPHGFWVFGATLFYTLGLIASQTKPVVLKGLIDSAIAVEPLQKYLLYLALVLFFSNLFFRTFDYFMIKSQIKIQKNFYDFAFDKVIQHSYTFFANTFTGSLVAKAKRFGTGFERIQDAFNFRVYNAIAMVLYATIIIALFDFFIASIVFVWALIYGFVSIKLTKRQREYDEHTAIEDSNQTAILSDILTNILTMKMFAKKRTETTTFKAQTKVVEKSMTRAWMYAWKVWGTQAILLALLEFFTLYFSIQSYQAGTMTLGTLTLIQLYAIMIFGHVWNFGRGVQTMSRALSDMKEMTDIINAPPDIVDVPKTINVNTKGKGEIIFDNVTFTYDKKPVLKNFNLRIKEGEKIGLVGESGSGKSTITKLILRFLDIDDGEILIDNQPIHHLKQEELRRKITYVPQEPLLFHRSIKDNIGYAKKSSLAQIVKAAKKAHADSFIKNFPAQYNTLVGERGIKLSGGERQRVAIARAILKDSPILIMDEATSSLDTMSENHIRDATEKLMKNKTTIVIAHRLSTVKRMDRIIVLSKGKIVEEGKHSQLLKKKGAYYNLYKHQSL